MARTELRQRGSHRLTDKQVAFCNEYLVNGFNAAKAYRDATGYKGKYSAMMAQKMLTNPKVKAYLGKARREQVEEWELTRANVLERLRQTVFRDLHLLADEEGYVISNLLDLPKEAHPFVDGFKVKQLYDKMGMLIGQEIIVKVSPNAAILDMAMKHFGLYAPDKQESETTVKINWDEMYERPSEPNAVEQRLLDLEKPNEQSAEPQSD